MSAYENAFELPKNIEHYLAALAKLYGQEDQRQLQEIIVNSQTRVHEEWSRDNWDGGTYGHALYLVVPELVYLKSVKQKDIFQKQIRDDINKIHNVQNEFIEEVFLEMEVVENQDWRKESGLLLSRSLDCSYLGKVPSYPTPRRAFGEMEASACFLPTRRTSKNKPRN